MNEQSEFKVGQQVRINVPPETMNGTTGTITGLAYGRYLVEFDAGGNGFFSGSDLEGEPLDSVTVTDELARLRAENRRLRDALKPFASTWGAYTHAVKKDSRGEFEAWWLASNDWWSVHQACKQAEEALKPDADGGA